MGFKKITYSLPALKTLLETDNSCVYCIENCHRSLTVLPAQLSNLKSSVHEYLSSRVTTCDPELQGIILSHKNVKVIDSVQLSDDGNYRLDYIADTYIFKPSVGSLLTGVVNKKSGDHLGVLVHSVFNATIPRPRAEVGCPKAWAGSGVKIGQQVTFEVIKLNFTARLPFIKGKLIDVEEKDNEDGGDSGIGGHDSTEEGSSYRANYQNSLHSNEKGKKKKKKKLSASGDNIEFREEEPSPGGSDSSGGRKNSSNLMELQSLLLNEAIATVSGKDSESGKEEEEKLQLENSKSGKKRKRESSLDLESFPEDQPTSSSSSHQKVKKKKLSETISNSESILIQEPEIKSKKKKSKDNSNILENGANDDKCHEPDVESTIENLLSFAAENIKTKKKKKKKDRSSCTSEMEDSSVAMETLSFCNESNASDVSLEKIKKKKKCSESREKSTDLDFSLYIPDTAVRLAETSDNPPPEEEQKDKKKKKKKKSLSLQEEDVPELSSSTLHEQKKKEKNKSLSSHEDGDERSTLISQLLSSTLGEQKKKEKKKSLSLSEDYDEGSSLVSELSSNSLGEHKKKHKKKKKSTSNDEFLQMENACIAELISLQQSGEIDTNSSEKKKKKKSKHSDVEIDSSILEADQMPPPATTKIKKKKSIVSFADE